MCRLNPVLRGSAPKPLVVAIEIYVVSVATFGAKVWRPGLELPSSRGIEIPSANRHCELTDDAVRLALRPVIVNGISSAQIIWENILLRLAAMISSLDG